MQSYLPDFKGYYKATKNVVLNLTEVEVMVKEATSVEKWGPTGEQMRKIAQATFNYNDFPLVMDTLFKRLGDPGKYWRHVYKALLVIDYCIHNGSEEVIKECRGRIIEIETLKQFQHIDEEDNKDVGMNVRERAKQIIELLNDDARIKSERAQCQKNRSKYTQAISNSGNVGYSDSFSGGGGYDHDDRYDQQEERSSSFDASTFENPRAQPVTAPVVTTPVAPAQQPPQQTNLIDVLGTPAAPTQPSTSRADFFSNTPSQPASSNFFDPRGMGSQPQSQPQAANTNFFMQPPAPAQPTPQIQLNFQNDVLQPSNVTAGFNPSFPQSNTSFPGVQFGDFAEASAEAQSGSAALWKKTELVDLDDLSGKKPAAQPAAKPKTPMGAMKTGMGMGMGPATGPAVKINTTPTQQQFVNQQQGMLLGQQQMMMGQQPVMMMGNQQMMGQQPVMMMGNQQMMMGNQQMMGQQPVMMMGQQPVMMMGNSPMMVRK